MVNETLICILHAGLFGEIIDDHIKSNISEDTLTELFELSTAHNVENIVADVLFKQKLMPDCEIAEVFRTRLMMSVLKYHQQKFEFETICNLFEENGICYIPLKGSVLRDFYPEPWLRSSCDIDILVKFEDLETASVLLESKLRYKINSKGSHDWGFFSGSGVHVELHYDLIEHGNVKGNVKNHRWNTDFLRDVWKTDQLSGNKKFEYAMSGSMFYSYHIAHMAKHFETGGCGIRPFLDLCIIIDKFDIDSQEVSEFMNNSGLKTFERAVRRLINVWFNDGERDDLCKGMEEYIIIGGVYGDYENQVAVMQHKTGGKKDYAISRIFLSYDIIKFHYPILNKHKWLLPFCQVLRWFKLLFCGGIMRSYNELKINTTLDSSKAKTVGDLIEKLGL